jgi:beta-N-acetylhexosaminidase
LKFRDELSRRRFLAAAAALTGSVAVPRGDAGAAVLMARDILKTMPLRDRVAQMFLFEARGKVMSPTYLADLTRVMPGGVLLLASNIGTAASLTTFISAIHATNAVIPPLVCIDQEGGPVTRLAGDPAPGAVQMGLLENADVTNLAKERAEFLATYGFDVNFAPVADIAYEPTSTMAARSFGNNPDTVAAKVSATVKGSRAGGVIGAAKHFPGHGRTQVDSHKIIPEIDVPWDEWLKTDAVPFESAVKARVDMVMLGHLRYERIDYKPMSISKVAVRALRDDLGFDGVIVTDDLGMGALADWDPLNLVSQAIDAGIDIMLYGSPPVGWDALIDHVVGMISDGLVDRQDINGRVEKIVALKLKHFGDRVS